MRHLLALAAIAAALLVSDVALAKCDPAAGWPAGKPCRDADQVGLRVNGVDTSLQSAYDGGQLGGGSSSASPQSATFAALPTCNGALEGARRTLTDARDANALAGGGGVLVVVRCEAGAWRSERPLALDFERDGKWDVVWDLWDADGDGSTWQTCTAKDAPIPQCKVAGELLYPDFLDDANCLLIGTCARSYGGVSRTATINLRAGGYVAFACWDFGAWDADASTPASPPSSASINDPREPARRDSTGDGAYQACPTDTREAGSPKIWNLRLNGFEGRFVGRGQDLRDLQTSSMGASRRRDRGTYIINDLGNDSDVWFSSVVGGPAGPMILAGYPFGGDSKGFGLITVPGAPTFETIESSAGSVCVATSGSFPGNLVDGDLLVISGPVNSLTTKVATALARADVGTALVQGRCDVGSIEVKLGDTHTQPGYSAFASVFRELVEGGTVAHADTGFLHASASIEDLSITPQDFTSEAGGDCGISALYVNGATVNADDDCDDRFGVNLTSAGSPAIRRVSFLNYHLHNIDTGQSAGTPIVEDVSVGFQRGGAIMDIAGRYQVRRLRVLGSAFNAGVINTFGVGWSIEDLSIEGSSFVSISSLSAIRQATVRRVRVSSSAHGALFALDDSNGECEDNQITDVLVTGRRTNGPGAQVGGALLDIRAVNDRAVRNNTFRDWREDVTGAPGGSARTMVYFQEDPACAQTNNCIRGNTFEGFKLYTRDAVNGASLFASSDAGTNAACVGAANPVACCTGAAAGTCEERVWLRNFFASSALETTGTNALGFAYCNGTPRCDFAIAGGTVPLASGILLTTSAGVTSIATTKAVGP